MTVVSINESKLMSDLSARLSYSMLLTIVLIFDEQIRDYSTHLTRLFVKQQKMLNYSFNRIHWKH